MTEYTVSAQVLSVPPDFDVVRTVGTSVTLIWGVSPHASGYEVTWKADSWSEWQTETTPSRSLTVASLPTDVTILFKIRALGDGVLYLDSEYSDTIDVFLESQTTKLAAPTILTGTLDHYVSYGANRHLIQWTDVENASGYTLEYSADGGATWISLNADETNRVYGADIRYRVRALGAGDYSDSDWSAVSTFRVCPMDINGDGDISGIDRTILIGSWLTEEGDERYRYYADVNGDGDVGGVDGAYLTANWLKDAGDDDLVYPPAKSALDEIFAGEFDDRLDVDLSDLWG